MNSQFHKMIGSRHMHYFFWLSLLSFSSLVQSGVSPGCGKPMDNGVHPGHSTDMYIQVNDPGLGEVTRYFRFHVPKSYDINTPLGLVVDYHGWTGDAHSQEKDSNFIAVADMDPIGFFVATPNGMGDNKGGMGSFNCSKTNGPLGPPCDTDRAKYGEIECYDSCPHCDSSNSCDWTTCFDDVAFTRAMIDFVSDSFCIEMNSVHQSGISNGGMFSYFIASQMSDVFASLAPVAGAPLIGFGDVPSTPVSLIDIHGINDDTIPYDLAHAEGEGPYESVISWDGFYYEQKTKVITKWREGLYCNPEPAKYATPMDGVSGWECRVWSGCEGGVEVVHCTADHYHDYPFGAENQYIEGTKIMWHFMNTHQKM